mgnify:FL=1
MTNANAITSAPVILNGPRSTYGSESETRAARSAFAAPGADPRTRYRHALDAYRAAEADAYGSKGISGKLFAYFVREETGIAGREPTCHEWARAAEQFASRFCESVAHEMRYCP